MLRHRNSYIIIKPKLPYYPDVSKRVWSGLLNFSELQQGQIRYDLMRAGKCEKNRLKIITQMKHKITSMIKKACMGLRLEMTLKSE